MASVIECRRLIQPFLDFAAVHILRRPSMRVTSGIILQYVSIYAYPYVRTSVCIYVCMYIGIYERLYSKRVFMYILRITMCMYECLCGMYVCIYVSMHIFMHASSSHFDGWAVCTVVKRRHKNLYNRCVMLS